MLFIIIIIIIIMIIIIIIINNNTAQCQPTRLTGIGPLTRERPGCVRETGVAVLAVEWC